MTHPSIGRPIYYKAKTLSGSIKGHQEKLLIKLKINIIAIWTVLDSKKDNRVMDHHQTLRY